MKPRTSFTADEISTIFQSFSFETRVVSPVDDEPWFIECELGDIEFICLMRPNAEAERLILASSKYIFENPFKFANTFNAGHVSSAAYVMLDDDEHVLLDEDGDLRVMLRMFITFDGGTTAENLEFLIDSWIEDLFDFHEVELEAEDAELPEMIDEVREMTVSEQVEWVLGDSVRRSAREIADHLMLEKHEVNSALYKDKSKFHRDGGQPPRWTLVN